MLANIVLKFHFLLHLVETLKLCVGELDATILPVLIKTFPVEFAHVSKGSALQVEHFVRCHCLLIGLRENMLFDLFIIPLICFEELFGCCVHG